MRNTRISPIIWAAVSLLFAYSCVASGTPGSELEIQKALVAKLRILRPGGSPETAAAIYVGKDLNQAYFVTAFHAVALSSNAVVPTVEVQLWNSPDTFVGQVLPKFDEYLDLAVVMIPSTRLPPQLPQVSFYDPRQTVKINIIGHPPAGVWSIWSGSIQNENAPQGDFQHFTTTTSSSLAPGYSGGPVLDLQGDLLGMHTKTNGPSYGAAAKITVIISQLKSWNVPTENLKPFDIVINDLSDQAKIYDQVKTNEMKLGQAGIDAFNSGNYIWAIRFLLRARAIQTSRVWSVNYPYLAGAFFLMGRTEDGNRTLQEMVTEAQRPNVFLSHPPPLGMAIDNCGRVRPKLSPDDAKSLDAALEKLVQIKQAAR